MTAPDMDRALQELIDKQAIGDVLARYARTLDWLDDAGQASCYWPDAIVDYGFFKGTAADFLPVVMGIERQSDRRWHMLAGQIIHFIGPDRANCECYGIFAGAKRQDDGTLAGNLYGGRYLDAFEKRGDEWRISSRTYILDWSQQLTDQPGFVPNPDFPLPTLEIAASGHPRYRAL
ncbi:nuclear transport factor 2 family protein [Novosphingobium sp.]|uniref:nuclear transport factor 2 family protein n=1 Tax=Novosphingobium sp. TaxID=1874826 RepID=UPI0025FD3727|nr:nuclear transport factor 2 family protein [Novosphingobium sp.]